EEFLEGEEASFFALCDGERAIPLATAQDHKQVGEGDTGPNTGGMGAYSPAPVMSDEMCQRTMDEIITPTIKAMKAAGTPYRGVLFAGLMITGSGPQLIEYNVRFGDPECQVLMMRLKSDLVELLDAAASGNLAGCEPEWSTRTALTVVMATKGYPGLYEKGSVISGVDEAGAVSGVEVFHAGTAVSGDDLVAAGGRVLNITGIGRDVLTARNRAYEGVAKISWPDGFYRSDIGWRALERETDKQD
ncbi:MAG TPA: phosphoribosylamine--glycine ligase, partial [Rhizobiales bacterium]|nr:phosphoribosylamine--glycine ligase [Hyphomicrobiales bacterium]